MLAKSGANSVEAQELIDEVPKLIKDVEDARKQPTKPDKPTTETKTATLAMITDQAKAGSKKPYGGGNYDITVTVTLSDGKITGVSAKSTAQDEDDIDYFAKLTDEAFYNNFKDILATNTDAINKIDAVSKATYSSATVKQAVKNALSN